MMRIILALVFLLFLDFEPSLTRGGIDIIYSNLKRIYNHGIKNETSWRKLVSLCDDFGPRLSGSENLENALDWIESVLKTEGFDSVWSEEVLVPKWVRIYEDCELIYPRRKVLPVMAFGGSVSTPSNGIFAEVLVVKSFDELLQKKELAKGKIVVYNPPYEGYGKTVQYRWLGAIRAAEVGAIAALCRPISPLSLNNPHTGVMSYNDTVPKIPFASLTEEDVLLLQRFQDRGITPKIYLKIETRHDGLFPSRNLIAQINGSVLPNEIIAFGGHLDSWDVGSGAHDDAGGCIITWESLRLIKELNIKPKRTLRLVFWVNEENGLAGGEKYAELHKSEPHTLLLEFDVGVFPPKGIGFTGPDTTWTKVKSFEKYIQDFYPNVVVFKGGGGVDISPMMREGYPGASISTDDGGKYFWFHHSHKDTPDKIDLKNLNDCINLTVMFIYLCSELL
ncbi:MAG: M20/M25/M40 family metallo-hydrolase [Ignavibacteria bacterium]|nr:M20/M25/M40 family metallo-hydrolase [Ignavibacteria bacterium]